jgi:hypothetical protein
VALDRRVRLRGSPRVRRRTPGMLASPTPSLGALFLVLQRHPGEWAACGRRRRAGWRPGAAAGVTRRHHFITNENRSNSAPALGITGITGPPV